MGIDLATLTDYTANGLNYTHKTDCIDSKSNRLFAVLNESIIACPQKVYR